MRASPPVEPEYEELLFGEQCRCSDFVHMEGHQARPAVGRSIICEFGKASPRPSVTLAR